MSMEMKITYICHSGFAVELPQAVLIFDYYRGEVPESAMEKPVYLFASHRHYDHFKREILTWKDPVKVAAWILSADLKEKKIHFPKEDVYFMGADETLALSIPEMEGQKSAGTLEIRTLGSTDEGVAFLVRIKSGGEERVVYHAGDLNWWHWEEEGPAYNAQMKADYQREIRKIEGVKIDAAFVPVDGRLDRAYYWGADYLMRHTDTQMLFPMHMWRKYELCRRFQEEPAAALYRERIMEIERKNQEFFIPARKEIL